MDGENFSGPSKEELFQGLDGDVSVNQWIEWEKLEKSAGGLIDSSGCTIEPQTIHVEVITTDITEPRPSTSGLNTEESIAGSMGINWSNIDSSLTLKYLMGQISFTEFSEEMDKQLAENESMPATKPSPSQTRSSRGKAKKAAQLSEDYEMDGSDDPDYEYDSKDEEWSPTAGEVSSGKEVTKVHVSPRRKRIISKKPRRRQRDVPKHLQGLMGEANLKFARGEHDEAIKMCMEVIRLAPQAVVPFQTLAMLYEELGDMQKSLQFYLIAAHLQPEDSEEWCRLAEIYIEVDDLKHAIYCYTKAIKSDPSNVQYVYERCNLYEKLDDKKKALEGYLIILKLIPECDGTKYLQLARNISVAYHDLGESSVAISTMKIAFEVHPDEITSEDVNMLLELMIADKSYADSLKLLVHHCGVVFDMDNDIIWSAHSEYQPEEADIQNLKPCKCSVAELMPIDLRVKLIISLINCKYSSAIVQIVMSPLFDVPEGIENIGDVFLDIAEAFLENGFYKEAKPILKRLSSSKNYNLAAVWLRYGECLNSLGEIKAAVEAYTKVVEMAPSHFGGRVSLSALQQQLGQPEEAVKALSQGEHFQGDISEQDQRLLLHKCHLLFSQGRFEDFYNSSKALLYFQFRDIYKPSFQRIVFGNRTHRHRSEGLKKILASQGLDFMKDLSIRKNAKSVFTVSTEDMWDIYLKVCESLLKLKRYPDLMEVAILGLTCPQFMTESQKVKEADFICLIACLLNKCGQFAYSFVKDICLNEIDKNPAWNLICRTLFFLSDCRHYRFFLRLMAKHPDNTALSILNGNNSLVSGSYKHALGEYMLAFRKDPQNPMLSLLIGLVFIHMASQKFSMKRHFLVTQGCAFLNIYLQIRGPCQESYYNLGRAMHQLDLLYAAVYYYKKALQLEPPIDEPEVFDLRAEIAHNLSLIYQASGCKELALMLLQKYCVI